MVIHFHQPVGNFGFVIDKITDDCYEPFLDVISEFPDIKFNLHYSGSLLEWFKRYRPSIIDKIKSLIAKGQVELVGGGFYEPILSVLLPEDAKGQIGMLSGFIKKEFGFKVSGCWLAERVWQQHLAEVFSDAGIRYIMLDEIHLKFSGLKRRDIYGYYVTEENLKTVSVFGADKALRYSIPFMPVEKTISYLRQIKEDYNAHVVSYGDDGEKFGAWPDTHMIVYEKKWLNNFLKALRKNSSWLRTTTVSEYMDNNPPLGNIYLPDASYQEMNEWSLPPDALKRLRVLQKQLKEKKSAKLMEEFLRGGVWKNFFIKYPESNHMHKRTLSVSRRIEKLASRISGPDIARLKRARKELYKAHCNCAYWHGIFGGIYLYHLRAALYKHLIGAEKILDGIEHKRRQWLNIEISDIDCDGYDEISVSTKENKFIINPAIGGSITEWDLKKEQVNILNLFSRKEEEYHKNFESRHRLDIYYDNYRRKLFIDRFLEDNVALDELLSGSYKDRGEFADAHYDIVRTGQPEGVVTLRRRSTAYNKSIQIDKTFIIKKQDNCLEARYRIRNLSSSRVKLNFAPEMNFSLTSDKIRERLRSLNRLLLQDEIEGFRLAITFSRKAKDIFRYPVNTVSQSQGEPNNNYQASCVVPVFDMIIDSNRNKYITIKFTVQPL
jgi:alpha-amylase